MYRKYKKPFQPMTRTKHMTAQKGSAFFQTVSSLGNEEMGP
jgi:hypothetical protein